jgi:hypothetical protein
VVNEETSSGLRRWGPRFNKAALIGVGLLSVAWAVRLASWVVVVMMPLLFVFAVACVLMVEALILRLRGMVPALPGPLARLESKLLWITIPIVVVVTLLREGVLAPHFTLNLNWWRATHYANANSTSQSSWSGTDAAPRFAGRPVVCTLSCTGAEAVCDGVDEIITCDDRTPTPDAVDLSISVDVGEPFCFVPLFKQADGSFSGSAGATVSDGQGSRSGSVSFHGAAGADATGIMSCRAFRKLYGREIGKVLASELDKFLVQN